MSYESNPVYSKQRKHLIEHNKKIIRLLFKNKIEHIWSGRASTGWYGEWYYYWDFKISKHLFKYIPVSEEYPNLIVEYDDFYIISLLVKEDGI